MLEQKFTTTRSTLRQVNGSVLATMFSRSTGRRLKHNKDGAVVLVFNPEHFSWILNCQRAKKISTPENPPLPSYHRIKRIQNTAVILRI